MLYLCIEVLKQRFYITHPHIMLERVAEQPMQCVSVFTFHGHSGKEKLHAMAVCLD